VVGLRLDIRRIAGTQIVESQRWNAEIGGGFCKGADTAV
jgi:hypothetical protein